MRNTTLKISLLLLFMCLLSMTAKSQQMWHTRLEVHPKPQITLATSQTILPGESIALFELTGTPMWFITYENENGDLCTMMTGQSPVWFDTIANGVYGFTIVSISDAYCYDTAFDNYSTSITVEGISLPFLDYVVTKWDNTFVLDIKRLHLEDINFETCEWYENGVYLGSGTTYCKGQTISDRFIDGATYRFELIMPGGWRIRSTDYIYQLENIPVAVYPNPVIQGNDVIVDLRYSENEISRVQIIDDLGRILYTNVFGKEVAKIPVNYSAGSYLIRVDDVSHKLIVVH